MDGIFISYRRDDSAGYAGRLYDRLVAHFGAERVFMDVEGIEPGLDFVEAIEQAVGSCRVLIAVIGDEWTTATDASGRRRLDDPNDFIRLETGSALQRSIRVVPVLVGGAVMPLATDLPDVLKPLTRRQAIEINHKQWEASTGELIRTLEGILNTPPAATGSDASLSKRQNLERVDTAPKAVGNDSSGQGGGRRRTGAMLIAAGLIAAVGLWLGLSDRVIESGSEKPPPSPPDSNLVAAPSQPPNPQPDPIKSAPDREQEPAVTPVAKPPSVPPSAPVAAAPAVPAPTPAPVIRDFRADSGDARTRLCYRISHAEIVTITPHPGEMGNVASGCIEVNVETATTFTLTARSGDRLTRKSLTVTPKPPKASVSPEPPPRIGPSERATTKPDPLAAPATATTSQFPVKGERWIYRSSGKWPTSPKRRFEIIAQTIENSVVTDELRVMEPERGGELRRSRGNGPGFIAWNSIGLEFAPYLGAFVVLAQLGSQSGFPTPDMDSQWTQWHSKASVLGQESVSVPAGTFNAFKVEVSSTRTQTGSFTQAQIEPVRVRYLVWYAPQVKRYVRMQRIIKSADGTESENDVFELVAHRMP